MNQVVVYLLTDQPDRVSELIQFFRSSSFFDFHVTNIPPPLNLPLHPNLTLHQSLEVFRFKCILEEAAKFYSDQYVLIIKDTSVIRAEIRNLENIIATAIGSFKWDLCYLTRWLDACELYRPLIKVSNTTLVKTFSPNGTQAILFSPSGRDIIIGHRLMNNGEYFTPIDLPLNTQLNKVISEGKISAICTVPNQFDFDLFYATKTSDLAKLSDCQRPDINKLKNGIPFFWFVAVVIILIILAGTLYIIGPKNTPNKNGGNWLCWRKK